MRHSILLSHVGRVVAVLLLLVALATGGSAVAQAANHYQNQDAAEQYANRAHFYRVLSGEESGSATVENQLARDLRATDNLNDFRGHSNSYGGIADAIGEDPFVSEGCEECGALRPEFREKVEQAKDGNVEQLISRDIPALDTSGFHFTPFGLSVGAAVGGLWMIGGPLALAVGHRRALHDRRYDVRQFADLNWNLNGKADGHKLTLIMLAPGFFIPYGIWRALNRRRFQKRVAECFSSEMQMVHEIDQVLDKISLRHGDHPKVEALQAGRDELVQEIESLTRAQSSGSVDDLIASQTERLEFIKGSLESRKEFAKELETQ